MGDIVDCLLSIISILDACVETYFEFKGRSWRDRYIHLREEKWNAMTEEE